MTSEFSYSPMFPLIKDTTEYEFLGSKFIETKKINGKNYFASNQKHYHL